MELKLGDFGLATEVSDSENRRKSVCGTPNYIAPEVLWGTNGHSFEVDIWALGVVTYTLLVGRPPFETRDLQETYIKIKNASYTFPKHVFISEISKKFIESLLQKNPKNRITLEKIMDHEFFTGKHKN